MLRVLFPCCVRGQSQSEKQPLNALRPAKLLVDSYLKPKALRRTTVVEEVENAGESSETVVDG
jgi:hypothetical protein